MSDDPALVVRQIYDKRLMDDLSKESNISPVRPDGLGVTVSEFAHANGISINPARNLLEAKVGAGKLQKTRMRGCNGGTGWVYYK